ncbi:hypothetical protein [Microcella sp.]|uniref:rhamnosyltransferase WsaF family glycosyltransferase n=1 Tax=Microcella sp. TaxID=1913979 RepID=UPI00391BCB3D
MNLVLSEFDPERVFAGVQTALNVAEQLSKALGMGLRIVILSETVGPHDRERLRSELRLRLSKDSADPSLAVRDDLIGLECHTNDVWIVTHWTTAHSAIVASRSGSLSSSRVVYLVQDYEPSFVPASTESVTSQLTYHGGFHLLVNSTPVAEILNRREGIEVDPARVFSPDLDLRSGELGAKDHGSRTRQRVFFYGRPSKPRNLFSLGVAALRVAAASCGPDVDWISAGESHPDVPLGNGHTLRSAGTLNWDDYFDLLAGSSVAVSLQASPHPSHPPLEAAARGVFTVTNEIDDTRNGLHPMLIAVPADPEAIGAAILDGLERTADGSSGQRSPSGLGRPLTECIQELADSLASA